MEFKKLYNKLKNLLEKKVLKRNYDLVNNNTYKLNCVAKIVVFVNSIETFVKTMHVCEEFKVKPVIISKGSNIILKNKKLNNIVIVFGDDFSNIYSIDNYIICESGARLSSIVKFAKDNNLGGVEGAFGIPGSIGGAVYMNAQAFDFETSKLLSSVLLYSNGKIKNVDAKDLEFGYRYSSIQNTDDIILRVELKCYTDSKKNIENKIKEAVLKRAKKQPTIYPNAGSVFRNGNNYFAGELIDKCGLKNYNIGNAYVSDKHGNFIENRGGATGSEIVKLIEFIVKEVEKKFNVTLLLEQRIIGD